MAVIDKDTVVDLAISLAGSTLAAYHTSAQAKDRIKMIALGWFGSWITFGVISAYVPHPWVIFVKGVASLIAYFVFREWVAYGDEESKTVVRWLIGKLKKKVE